MLVKGGKLTQCSTTQPEEYYICNMPFYILEQDKPNGAMFIRIGSGFPNLLER